MDVVYKNRKLQKICTDASVAEKKYGPQMAEKIQMRIDQIRAAPSIEDMIRHHIGRCHGLGHNRENQYAVDLVQPVRLVFEKKNSDVQVVCIIEIVDYHK